MSRCVRMAILCLAFFLVLEGIGRAQDPGSILARQGEIKEKLLGDGGGTKETEAAVKRGLLWLAKAQTPAGSWKLDGAIGTRAPASEVTGTALGVLPFLGYGRTHKPAKDNPYDKNVERALSFLLRNQDRKTGGFPGGPFTTGLVTMALAEAYALTKDKALEAPTQAAVNYLTKSQADDGGWRAPFKKESDTVLTSMAVLALWTAKQAELDVLSSPFKKARGFFDSRENPDGGYGLAAPSPPDPTATASALLCRQFLQSWGPDDTRLVKGINNILKKESPKQSKDIFLVFQASQVFRHFSKEGWKTWNADLQEALLKSQDTGEKKETLAGSWAATDDVLGRTAGRVYTTALSLLALEAYYRHVPLYGLE